MTLLISVNNLFHFLCQLQLQWSVWDVFALVLNKSGWMCRRRL